VTFTRPTIGRSGRRRPAPTSTVCERTLRAGDGASQDSATVTGGGVGTVTFTLYKNDATCSNASAIVYTSGSVGLISGTASTSITTFAVSSVGAGGDTYYWHASYSGDTTHKSVTS